MLGFMLGSMLGTTLSELVGAGEGANDGIDDGPHRPQLLPHLFVTSAPNISSPQYRSFRTCFRDNHLHCCKLPRSVSTLKSSSSSQQSLHAMGQLSMTLPMLQLFERLSLVKPIQSQVFASSLFLLKAGLSRQL